MPEPKAFQFTKPTMSVVVQAEASGAMMMCMAVGAPEPLMRLYDAEEYGGEMTREKAEQIADDAEKEVLRRFEERWFSEANEDKD